MAFAYKSENILQFYITWGTSVFVKNIQSENISPCRECTGKQEPFQKHRNSLCNLAQKGCPCSALSQPVRLIHKADPKPLVLADPGPDTEPLTCSFRLVFWLLANLELPLTYMPSKPS